MEQDRLLAIGGTVSGDTGIKRGLGYGAKKTDDRIEIKVRCKGSHYCQLEELNILQEKDSHQLKMLDDNHFQQLRRLLETKGFWFPFFIWIDSDGKKWYLDGTQRDKVLHWMEKQPDRYRLPEKYPCAEIEASSRDEAAEAILTQSTRIGQFTEDGLSWFITEFNLQMENLKLNYDLPDINWEKFELDWLEKDNFEKMFVNQEQERQTEMIECPKCGYRW